LISIVEINHTGGKLEDAKFAEISHDQIHEARTIRDAEIADPGAPTGPGGEAAGY
jgi:hypothetical protein